MGMGTCTVSEAAALSNWRSTAAFKSPEIEPSSMAATLRWKPSVTRSTCRAEIERPFATSTSRGRFAPAMIAIMKRTTATSPSSSYAARYCADGDPCDLDVASRAGHLRVRREGDLAPVRGERGVVVHRRPVHEDRLLAGLEVVGHQAAGRAQVPAAHVADPAVAHEAGR